MGNGTTRRSLLSAAVPGGAAALSGVHGAPASARRSTAGPAGRTSTGPQQGGSPAGSDRPGPCRRVLFDSGRELVGWVTLFEEPRYVFRYDNPIPGAAGIEVWHEEGRIRGEGGADRTLLTLSWSQVLGVLRDRRSTIDERFPRVVETATTIERRLGGAESALEYATERIGDLRDISVEIGFQEISVWDVLTRAYPTLGRAASAIETAHDTLEGWTEAANSARDALPALREYLGGIEDLHRIDADTASSRVESARDALRSLYRQASDLLDAVESLQEDANAALDRLEQSDDRIVSDIRSVTDIPIPRQAEGIVSDAVEEVTDGVRSAVNRLFSEVVDPLLEPVREFRDDVEAARTAVRVDPTATDRRDRMKQAWAEREDADVVVNGMGATVGLVATLVLASAWVEPTETPGEADE